MSFEKGISHFGVQTGKDSLWIERTIRGEVFCLDIDTCDFVIFKSFHRRGIIGHDRGDRRASKSDEREINEEFFAHEEFSA